VAGLRNQALRPAHRYDRLRRPARRAPGAVAEGRPASGAQRAAGRWNTRQGSSDDLQRGSSGTLVGMSVSMAGSHGRELVRDGGMHV